jgi:hypothetical protein
MLQDLDVLPQLRGSAVGDALEYADGDLELV